MKTSNTYYHINKVKEGIYHIGSDESIPFQTSLFPESEAKICIAKKENLKNVGKFDCPAIVIDKSRLI